MSQDITLGSQAAQIAEQMNAQSEQAYSQFAMGLPSISALSSNAYSFESNANQALNSSQNSLASNLIAGIQQQTTQAYNMSQNAINTGMPMYNQIAQTGKSKT